MRETADRHRPCADDRGKPSGCRNSTSTSAQARLFGLVCFWSRALGMFCSRKRSRLPLYAARVARRGDRLIAVSCATRGAASACRYPRPSKSGVISFTPCGLASMSIPSMRPPVAFSRRLERSSFSRPAIRSPRNAGCEATRQPASAAGVFVGVFRYLLDGGRVDVRGDVRGVVMKRSVARKALLPARNEFRRSWTAAVRWDCLPRNPAT